MNKVNKFCMVFFFLLTFLACKKDKSNQRFLDFKVVDEFTLAPIANVEVSVLENGIKSFTNEEGLAHFSESELKGFEVSIRENEEEFAFLLNHVSYKTKEMNASFGLVNVSLSLDTSKTYHYSKPVELKDNLETNHINQVGIDSALIYALGAKLATSQMREVHSLLVFKDNFLVVENYFKGNNDTIQFENNVIRDRSPDSILWNRNQKHYIASVNKALTSIVTGIALNEKNVSVDSTIKNFLPDYNSFFQDEPKKSSISYHHTLNMTSGFLWNEWSSNDLQKLWKTNDFTAYVLARTNFGQRSGFVYNSALSNMVLNSLQNMLGEDVRNWADTHFYKKLGITDYLWQSQPNGLPEGAARMYLRPRDMLKIGITVLNKGKWQGEQVIPESWVNKIYTKQVEFSGGKYSYGFWLRELKGISYIAAEGDGGNLIAIFPNQNMVVVLTQGNYLQNSLYTTQINSILETYILPALN